jgi:hypothetical protein
MKKLLYVATLAGLLMTVGGIITPPVAHAGGWGYRDCGCCCPRYAYYPRYYAYRYYYPRYYAYRPAYYYPLHRYYGYYPRYYYPRYAVAYRPVFWRPFHHHRQWRW